MKEKSAFELNSFKEKYDRHYSIGDLTPTIIGFFAFLSNRAVPSPRLRTIPWQDF